MFSFYTGIDVMLTDLRTRAEEVDLRQIVVKKCSTRSTADEQNKCYVTTTASRFVSTSKTHFRHVNTVSHG